MCYSATASFTFSTLLISTGIFSAVTAFDANKSYLPFSFIPIFFGIQQSVEGIIWWQLHAGHLFTAHIYAYIYLFFALYFWPCYVPMCVYVIEKKELRKKIMTVLIFLGGLLGAILYVPILFGSIPIEANIQGHSIHYEVYPWGPVIWGYTAAYLLILVTSLLLSSVARINRFGMMTLISMIATYWWYIDAFISIWCFFSAILSFYISFIIYKLSIIRP